MSGRGGGAAEHSGCNLFYSESYPPSTGAATAVPLLLPARVHRLHSVSTVLRMNCPVLPCREGQVCGAVLQPLHLPPAGSPGGRGGCRRRAARQLKWRGASWTSRGRSSSRSSRSSGTSKTCSNRARTKTRSGTRPRAAAALGGHRRAGRGPALLLRGVPLLSHQILHPAQQCGGKGKAALMDGLQVQAVGACRGVW